MCIECLHDYLLCHCDHFVKGSTINHFNMFNFIMKQRKISYAQMI